MTTRTGRRRRLLDGKLVDATHEPHLPWESLVRRPAPVEPRKRRGAFYRGIRKLPTPAMLRVRDALPETFKGLSRRQRRAFGERGDAS